MSLDRTSAAGRKLGFVAFLAAVALGVALVAPASAPAVTPASCPSFAVLHDDRIGPASLPTGTYTIELDASSGLSCAAASKLFARFLQDYDGVLPKPWRVVAKGSGKASFEQGARAGFAVSRSGGNKGGGANSLIGDLCPGTFIVNSNVMIGPVLFPRGPFLIYIPGGSGVTCNRASLLFTQFLGQPEGRLPFPWRLKNQTGTFFKPENPARSAFRVEALAGAGPA